MFAQHAIDSADPTHYHHSAVRRELEEASTADALAREALKLDDMRDRFARRLMERGREAARILTDTTLPTSFEEATRTEETPRGAVLWADAKLAELVGAIGDSGNEAADAIRTTSAEKLRELVTP